MICRKATFTIPDANPLLFEHKIWFFVRFWGLESLFSGFSSTKSGFLCARTRDVGLDVVIVGFGNVILNVGN